MQPVRGGPTDTFRRRAKTSEQATQREEAQKRARHAKITLDALSSFEANLAQAQNARFKDYEDLDEASTMGDKAPPDGPAGLRTVGELREACGSGGQGPPMVTRMSTTRSQAAGRGRESRANTEEGQLATRMESMRKLNSIRSAAHGTEHGAAASVPALGSSPGKAAGEAASGTRRKITSAEAQDRRQTVCAKRPPSPLSLFDYGSASIKPRSIVAQQRGKLGDTARSDFRRTSPGFLFPGTRCERGPYGFSIIDPMLLPSRAANAGSVTPEFFPRSPGDVRPHAQQDLRAASGQHAEKPVISAAVRTTAAHAKRAQLAFQHMDKRKEEDVLEQTIFENGVYEGRWRDPSWDGPPQGASSPSDGELAWLRQPVALLSEAQLAAMRILYGLENALCNRMGHLNAIFCPETRANSGLLELQGFKRCLIKCGAVGEDDVSLDALREVACALDPTFDGRVSLHVVERALRVFRGLEEPPPAHELGLQPLRSHRNRGLAPAPRPTPGYGAAAPVDPIRLNFRAGLFNFSKSLDSFKKQQKQLANHYAV